MDVTPLLPNRRFYCIGPEQWVERFGMESKNLTIANVPEPFLTEERDGPRGMWLAMALRVQEMRESVAVSENGLEEIVLFYGTQTSDWSGQDITVTPVKWIDREGIEKVRFAFSV